MQWSSRVFSVLLLIAVTSSVAFAEPPARSWQERESSVALMQGEQVVWKFSHDPEAPKSYFHPVALPDGPVLTWNQPPDHRWHHGLWFSWKFLNGVNFWEPNRSTGKPDGQTRIEHVGQALRTDH